MKNILLISPDFNPEKTAKVMSSLSGIKALTFIDSRAYMVPLGLATVAALTPDDVDVDIWDEAVHGEITDETELKKNYDLVGVTGYTGHIARVWELGAMLRRRGILTAVGGPGVSAAPEHYRDHFDILFIGEAEYIWPEFLAEWKDGKHRLEYRQVGKVDMAHSPLPRWDKVAADMRHYLVGGVQTTRGCPFDCEFCDVIYIYGRQARHKSINHVLSEISAMERLGVSHVFLCDDNFIGNPRYGKSLLRELIPLNRSFRRPLGFHTQITLNVAKDDEMLGLLADANFIALFIGVETPNKESLIETNKPQNYKTDIVADIKKIHSYAMPVQGSMIVGFDHDDTGIFDMQFDFLQESGIVNPGLTVLQAPIGTKLWVRLHKEGRVVRLSEVNPTLTTSHQTNIIPKRMTRAELLSGFHDLVKRVRDWHNFEVRAKRMLDQVQRRPNVRRSGRHWTLMPRFVKFFCFSMDREARATCFRLILYTLRRAPFMLDRVIRMIARQYIEAMRAPGMLRALDEQVRLERTGETQVRPEPTVFFVPDAFKKPYKSVFPELHAHVSRGLVDKKRTENALVEVIYDFVTRWGLSFREFEEYHRTFLYELCDRTIAKENGELEPTADGTMRGGDGLHEMTGLTDGQVSAKVRQLGDDVLRYVEQELRDFQGTQRGSSHPMAEV